MANLPPVPRDEPAGPAAATSEPPGRAAAAAQGKRAKPAAPSGPKSRHWHWLLMLTLIPLAVSMCFGDRGSDIEERLKRTLAAHPEILERLAAQNAADADLFDVLPDHAIDGAFLAHDTFLHWLFALAAAGLFLGLIASLFDLGGASLLQILLVGLFTSTVGVISLLLFQVAADWTQNWSVTGRGIVVILFWIVKLIGFSYRAALNPENGFIVSLLGFTFGVGLCEELTKILPLLLRRDDMQSLGWRGTLVWGLASGAGFGIAEGVLYAGNHYNGLATGGVYLIRFISCVALHAVWTGTSALTFYRRQDLLEDLEGWHDFLLGLLLIIAVPMVLHGLYDTLLKRDMDLLALGAAVASFLPLAWMIEQAHSDDVSLAERAQRRAAAGAKYA